MPNQLAADCLAGCHYNWYSQTQTSLECEFLQLLIRVDIGGIDIFLIQEVICFVIINLPGAAILDTVLPLHYPFLQNLI
jgi:hypothetical protein